MKAKTYKQLVVWRKSIDLTKEIYLLTSAFPKSELYGLTSQMRRCAVSIPSNIAEGNSRSSKQEYARFLTIAMGSIFELETQLLIAMEVGYITREAYDATAGAIDEVEAMLAALKRRLLSQSPSPSVP